jgi:hypothetical protein
MKKTFLFAMFMAFLSLCGPSSDAQAMYLSSADLAAKCISDRSEDIHDCTSYVAGVIDYHMLLQSLGTNPTMPFCMPESVSMQQAAVIVMAFLKTAPQHDAFVAASAIPLAINKAFPCAAPKKKK